MAARRARADAGPNPAVQVETGAIPPAMADFVPRAAPGGKAKAAPAKRQRVSRACDQCRAMREKCDGSQPQCSSCVSQNRACTYKTSPKKRGVQTGYIRTLEVTLSSLIDEVPGCAEALDGLFSRQGEAQRLFNPETGGQQDLDRHNRLHRRWNKSRARREINRILSTDGTSGSQAMSDRGSDDGTDTDPGPRLGTTTPRGPQRPTPTSAAWYPGESTNPSPMTAGNTDDSSTTTSSRSILTIPPNHRQLLDIYFSYTHSWFPILERRDLLKTAHQCERQALDPTSTSAISLSESSAVSELWSVMALASYHCAACLGLPEVSSNPVSHPTRENTHKPDQIYKMARRIIPSDDGPFEIQHARALLILSLINIGQRKYTAARMQVRMARHIAEETVSRSNLQQPDPRPDQKAVDAVLVGCCILDAMSAIVRLLPELAGPGIAAAAAPVHSAHSCTASVPEDGLDEWQTWAPCLGFGGDHAPTEHGPAYSLSTLNQLHSLMTTMQQKLAIPSNVPRPAFAIPANTNVDDLYTLDTRALDQAIRHGLPSTDFIRSSGQASSSVPSAYVVRITFIWAHIVLSSKHSASGVAQSLITIFADAIEQFITNFGAAAMPPIIVPLVHSIVETLDFASSQHPIQQRWLVLLDAVESTWSLRRKWEMPGRLQLGEHAAGFSVSVAASGSPHSNISASTQLAVGTSPDNGRGVPVTGQYTQKYQSMMPGQNSTGTGYASQAVARGYGHPRIPISPQEQIHPTSIAAGSNPYHTTAIPASHLPAPHNSTEQLVSVVKRNNSPRPSGPEYPGTPSGHPLIQSTLPPPHSQHIRPVAPSHVASFDFTTIQAVPQAAINSGFEGSVDYDSLLDDLASTDYLERLDADIGAQFMANLGFAPGSDNLGTVMGEYSGL